MVICTNPASTPHSRCAVGAGWRLLAGIQLILGMTAVMFSQQPAGAASAASVQQPDGQAAETLHVAVRRVVVDVVVTDATGKPVTNLAQQDFNVYEDGKLQQMRSFDKHVAEAQPALSRPELPPNTFSNLSAAPRSGPVTVVLYDLLNTPLDAQSYARAQLLQFLKQRAVSGQVAIFVLSDKLHMLQGFTDDENQLIAALNTQNARLYKSSNLQSPGEATQQSDSLARTDGNQNGADADQNVSFQEISGMLKHMESMESSAMLDRRVDITVDALEEISRFLIGLPGRKNLLWLSGSFPTEILPDESFGGRDSFDVTRNYSSTIVQATDMLNLAHIAVYPIDVRGLQVNPMYSGASNQTFEPGSGKDLAAVSNFSQQNNAEHATMNLIGDQTGGHAFYNTNGLKEAAAAAIEDGSAYFTLTYAPSDTKLDGGIRRVRVELTKPGYHLSYRRTYFADKLDSEVANYEDDPNDPLAVTLDHGAPAAHELFFEAHLQTLGPPSEATPEQMAVLAQYGAMSQKGKHKTQVEEKKPILMQRYLITYGLLLRQLQLPAGADGVRRGTLDVAVMSYDDDGQKLDGIRSRINDVIQPDRYVQLEQNGYQVIQTIAVPVQTASLRLAVRDASTNHLGSLEVHLPLASAP
jgi:VWFA-related protein